MVFKDYEYIRPDFLKVKEEFNKNIEVIKNSNNSEDVIKAVDAINKIINTKHEHYCYTRK